MGGCRHLRHLGTVKKCSIFSYVLRDGCRCFRMAGERTQQPIPEWLFNLLAKRKRRSCLRTNRYQELAPKTYEVKIGGVKFHTNKDTTSLFWFDFCPSYFKPHSRGAIFFLKCLAIRYTFYTIQLVYLKSLNQFLCRQKLFRRPRLVALR